MAKNFNALFLGVLAAVLFALPALAQEQLDIQSDSLSIDNKENSATFTGNVRVVRDEVTMNADKVFVDYVEKKQGEKVRNDVKLIEATGHVKIVDGKKTITANKAIYDVEADKMTLIDDVVVKEGPENTITGTKMLYDMTQGLITVTSDSGRVRATLIPNKK